MKSQDFPWSRHFGFVSASLLNQDSDWTIFVALQVGLWYEITRSKATTARVIDHSHAIDVPSAVPANYSFRGMSQCCRQITQASRCCRSMEVIVQARWIQCFDEQVQSLAREDSGLSLTKARMVALADASKDFGWSLKELRNKMYVRNVFRVFVPRICFQLFSTAALFSPFSFMLNKEWYTIGQSGAATTPFERWEAGCL